MFLKMTVTKIDSLGKVFDEIVKRMLVRMVARSLRSKVLPMFTPAATLHSHATSFGFKEVNEEEKSQLVGNVFTKVA
ncbi:hypothetical protein L1987_21205 [Smallanthus sonchifolius]|uniref:Uncharacterized protein n=1 Tax=Smallanthus sonchifolius TaxID=185202 RepID=A0ACB9IVG8_9ASTR|nr:hypothetical protein L1987_21205 [Smallanthus sonchifolius]